MARVLKFFLVISICLCVSSCGLLEFGELTAEYVAEEVRGKTDGVIESFAELEEDSKYLDELGAEVVRCFDEKDVEGLKVLFCSKKKGESNLNSQIQNAFNLYDSKSQSFYVTNKSWTGGRIDGEYDKKCFTPYIRITTNKDEEYTIVCLLYTINVYDTGKIGILTIGLRDKTGDEIAVIR